jgi:hypothetical protein
VPDGFALVCRRTNMVRHFYLICAGVRFGRGLCRASGLLVLCCYGKGYERGAAQQHAQFHGLHLPPPMRNSHPRVPTICGTV